MFKAELTKEVQVRQPRQRKVKAEGSQQQQNVQNESSSLQRRLQKNGSQTTTLGSHDIVHIMGDVRLKEDPYKQSMITSLCCRVKYICKKDRHYRLRKKAFNRLDKMLDIRAFFKMQTNLALLISLLMTKEQTQLFQHHRARALHYEKDGLSSDSSSDSDNSGLKKHSKKKAYYDQNNLRTLPELPSFDKKKDELVKLVGYDASTALDRKLLLGVLESDEEPAPQL